MTVDLSLFIRRTRRLCLLILFVVVGLGGLFNRVFASQSVELSWDPSTDGSVVSYKVYYGTLSGQYSSSIAYGDISDVVISGLADGQTYYFAVSAIDDDGNESALSNQVIYKVPSAADISLQAEASTAAMQAVDLTWTPSADSDVFGYAVFYGTQSGDYTNFVVFYGATEGVIPDLAGNTTYYFAVAPIDSYGIGSITTSEVAYTVPAAQPITLAAQMAVDSPGVALAWNAPSGEGTVSYNVYYGTESGSYTQSENCGDVNDFIVLGLNSGQIYYFVVTSVDAYGDESPYSNEASSEAAAPPPVQIQVQATTSALEAVDVSWTPSPDSDVYGYCVDYWAQNSGVTNSEIFYGVTNGIISGLGGGTNYDFAVAPVDSYGIEAVASSTVSYTVPVPQPITLEAQMPIDSPGVELTWNAPSDEGTVSYNVYYGTESGSYTQSENCGDVNDFIVLGLNPGQIYYFVVTSVDAYGNESPHSNEANSGAAAPPPVQIQVQGTTSALEAVDVSWTPSPDSEVYGYCVDYWVPNAGVTNSTVFYGVTDGIISGLGGGTNYDFAVAPVDSYGIEAIASIVVSYTVPVPQPIVLQAQTVKNPAGVELTWNTMQNEGVVGYHVYYGTESGNYGYSINCSTNDVVIPGLDGGQTYYFAVDSVDEYGNQSPFSNEASAVPPNPPPMLLQTKIYYDGNGQPYMMEINTPSTVYGNWEVDESTDLQNWTPYTYGSGSGTGDGYDVDVYISIDPTQPQVFFRVINY